MRNARELFEFGLLLFEIAPKKVFEKCWNKPNLTFGGFWWPDLWPDLKNDRSSFIIISDVLSNAAYRVSLRGPGAEIERGSQQQQPSPQQVVENLKAQQGAG